MLILAEPYFKIWDEHKTVGRNHDIVFKKCDNLVHWRLKHYLQENLFWFIFKLIVHVFYIQWFLVLIQNC